MKRLLLDKWDNPEFAYADVGKGNLFVIPSQYPYNWVYIKYGDDAIKLFEEGGIYDLKKSITHELVHVILDEMNTKHRNKAKDKEWTDSLETTVEHITSILIKSK